MARDLKEYRIFFASPGGLQKERLAFRDIITEYNQLESGQRGIHFVAVGWEDTQPAELGRRTVRGSCSGGYRHGQRSCAARISGVRFTLAFPQPWRNCRAHGRSG